MTPSQPHHPACGAREERQLFIVIPKIKNAKVRHQPAFGNLGSAAKRTGTCSFRMRVDLLGRKSLVDLLHDLLGPLDTRGYELV